MRTMIARTLAPTFPKIEAFFAVTADAASVFVKAYVTDVVEFVLDTPVATIEDEQPMGVGPLRFKAGDPVGDLDGVSTVFPPFASDLANLLKIGPSGPEVGRQFCRGDQRAALASAMPFVTDRGPRAGRSTLPLLVGGKPPRLRRKSLRCLVATSVGCPSRPGSSLRWPCERPGRNRHG